MRNSKWWIVISIVLIALGTALIISAIILVQSAASNPELATNRDAYRGFPRGTGYSEFPRLSGLRLRRKYIGRV